MKQVILLLLLATFSLLAGEPWPGVPFAEVRAFAWPDDNTTRAVVLPGMALKAGVINEGGSALSPAQVQRLRAAVTGPRRWEGGALCYTPHNAFVFYNAAKEPVAFVEICFSCLRYKAEPKGTAEAYDLLALAAIFDELKLPMGEYPDLHAFKKKITPDSK